LSNSVNTRDHHVLNTGKSTATAVRPALVKKTIAARYVFITHSASWSSTIHPSRGDFLKEHATLGVEETAIGDSSDVDKDSSLKWNYVSAQEPDEVLFIKLFDTAALGEDAQHAPGLRGMPLVMSRVGRE
jgi:hypothetical protein